MARPEPRINLARREIARVAQATNAGIVAAASAQATAVEIAEAAVSDAVAANLPIDNTYLAARFEEINVRLSDLEGGP